MHANYTIFLFFAIANLCIRTKTKMLFNPSIATVNVIIESKIAFSYQPTQVHFYSATAFTNLRFV